MGVGLNKHYASVWFGQRPDRAGKPKMCRSAVKNKEKAPAGNTFYLIYGSYPSQAAATKALHHVKARGFRDVGMLRNHTRIRVYLYRSTDFQKIKNVRQKLKKKYPQLWILQK